MGYKSGILFGERREFMDGNIVGALICMFIFFGWIPILAMGKAISMIILACKAECNCLCEDEDE